MKGLLWRGLPLLVAPILACWNPRERLNQLVIAQGNGEVATFDLPTPTNVNCALAVGKINFDDTPDAISPFLVALLEPSLSEAKIIVDEKISCETFALADVDGDGLDDLYCPGEGKIQVFLSQGDGSLRESTPLTIEHANWVSVGDVNGDGVADLLGGGSAGAIVKDGASGEIFAFPELTLLSASTHDVDGDVTTEIIGEGSVFRLVNEALELVGTYEPPITPKFGDANGDGVVDLLDPMTPCFLPGLGSGKFAGMVCASGRIEVPNAWGDFNGDGRLDVVSLDLEVVQPETATFWLGQPDGKLGDAEPQHWSVLQDLDQITVPVAADIDGDGDDEVLFQRKRHETQTEG